MKNNTIGIIGAMDSEVKSLKLLLTNMEEIKQGEFIFYKGIVGDKTVVVVKSGIGKVASAVCAQIMIDKFNPDFIINTGVAGGLGENLNIGDIVIAEKLVQHDFDVSALGYVKANICNGINPNEPTYFYSDKNLIEKFKNSILGNYHIGIIASGDIFIASSDKKKELKENFGAIAAEMEGAAIAHCAVLNKIPFLVIRSISDLADDKAEEGYKFNEEQSANISANAIKQILYS